MQMGRVTGENPTTADLARHGAVDRTVGDDFALDRSSVVEQVVVHIRSRIVTGHLKPGERLREQPLAVALGVSRNTLREACRVLVQERVLVREARRGVLVRQPTEEAVREIYRTRRLIEGAAIRAAAALPRSAFTPLRAAVRDGETAAKASAWNDVGTADIVFHARLVALAGSRHLDELFRILSAELRLSFQAVDNMQEFHRPYLKLNRKLYTHLASGDTSAAEQLLDGYLTQAEDQVVAATRSITAGRS